MNIIFLLLLLSPLPVIQSLKTKNKLSNESSLFCVSLFVVAILYFAGLLNILLPVYLLCVFCGIVFIGYSIYISFFKLKIKNFIIEKDSSFILRCFSPGIILFLLANIVYSLFVLDVNEHLYGWDEFSYWAGATKQILFGDCLKDSSNYFGNVGKNYPPGSALWDYFYGRIILLLNSDFDCERLMYAGKFCFISLCCLPFLSKIRWKNIYLLLPLLLMLIYIPMLMNSPMRSLTVDFPLGCFAAAVIALIFIEGDNIAGKIYYIIPALIVLVLFKGSGMFFVLLIICFALFIMITEIIKQYKSGLLNKKIIFKQLILFILLVGIPFCTFISWGAYCKAKGLAYKKGAPYAKTYQQLRSPLKGKYSVIYNKFMEKLEYDKAYNNKTISPYNLFAIILLLLVLPTFLIKSSDEQKNKVLCLAIIIISGALIYAFGLLATYFYYFGAYEGTRCASIMRYFGSYLCFSCFCAVIPQLNIGQHNKNQMAAFYIVVFIAFYLYFPTRVFGKYVNNLLFKVPETAESVKTDNFVKETLNFLPEGKYNEKIYYIYQKSNGFHYCCALYSYYPYYKLNGWSVAPAPQFKGDVWTHKRNAKQFAESIKNYNYLVIQKSNKIFWDSYGKFFVKGKAKSHVYKINYKNKKLELIPMDTKRK